MECPYRNLLFDIGVVLLNLEYEQALARFAAFCPPERIPEGKAFFTLVARDPMLAQYELGRVSSDEFYKHFRGISGFQGSFEDFRDVWRSIFSENTPMVDFVRELANAYDVYYLTNASELHVPYIYSLFPRLAVHRDDAVSCYLHAAKPDPDFYEKALRKFGIQPETCLFIDDRRENIMGAEAFGLRSVLYTTPDETIAAVRRLLATDGKC